MLMCFFDRRGVVDAEFTSPGQTVNPKLYLEVLKRGVSERTAEIFGANATGFSIMITRWPIPTSRNAVFDQKRYDIDFLHLSGEFFSRNSSDNVQYHYTFATESIYVIEN